MSSLTKAILFLLVLLIAVMFGLRLLGVVFVLTLKLLFAALIFMAVVVVIARLLRRV